MQVACPICWHSVWTPVECRECGLVQCLEYEGPKCIACGGSCKKMKVLESVPAPEKTEATA